MDRLVSYISCIWYPAERRSYFKLKAVARVLVNNLSYSLLTRIKPVTRSLACWIAAVSVCACQLTHSAYKQPSWTDCVWKKFQSWIIGLELLTGISSEVCCRLPLNNSVRLFWYVITLRAFLLATVDLYVHQQVTKYLCCVNRFYSLCSYFTGVYRAL